MSAALTIEAMNSSDWDAVRLIYQQGLDTGNATFETTCPNWEEWNSRHHSFARLIARISGQAIAWAALSPVSSRAVYAGVAEVSIYVENSQRGTGVGTALLQALVTASEHADVWTLQASIFPENAPSIVLHQKLGFRVVGRRERIGRLHGQWRDTLLLERRSTIVANS